MEEAYLDPKRFPLTTQRGLRFESQRLIDAHNLDELNEMIERGQEMDEEQKARHKELLEKFELAREHFKSRRSA